MYSMYPNYGESMNEADNSGRLTLRADKSELVKWGLDDDTSDDFAQARNVAIAERAADSEQVFPSRSAERALGYVGVNPMVLE